jgi:plasmid stabilization system protein ParE
MEWYEAQAAGLGREFLEAVHARFADIEAAPERFPRVTDRLRRAMLHRFPYALFYTQIDDRLHIVACMHGRRDPARWLRRG